MSDVLFETAQLHDWLDRWRAGDQSALDALFRAVGPRLERLAQHMLRGFPNVRRYADTGDVLQNALVRLHRSLAQLHPESTRDFFNLAALHIRRELLDLARFFRRREQAGLSPPAGTFPEDAAVDDGAELDRWQTFHEAVEQLSADEREIVSLRFYHGWSNERIAELLQISERTVRRRWERALFLLSNQCATEASS